MRARVVLGQAVVGTVLLALSGAPAHAGPPKGPWEGYGVGTWVHTKTTSTSEIPGVASEPQVMEQRQSLVKVTDAEWVVRTEMKIGEAWTGATEFAWPRKGTAATPPVEAPKVEDLGTEDVTVEGKAYSCKKQRTVVPVPGGDAASASTTTSWTSDEHGLLKSHTESPGNSMLLEVTALAKKAKAGDREVVCRETKVASKSIGMEMVSVSLTSEAVPGQSVRSDMTTSMSGVRSRAVSEVVGFEVK